MSFSERMGIHPARDVAQLGSMDSALRNGLWNCFLIFYRERGGYFRDSENRSYFLQLWREFYKLPTDLIKEYEFQVLEDVRAKYFKAPWNEVYDFVEFTLSALEDSAQELFAHLVTEVLVRERSGYRLVGGVFVPITDEGEIAAIEKATSEAGANALRGVRAHLVRAIELLSDRQKPDFRNSVKESISAVESICQVLTKNPKAELSDALALLEKSQVIHGAMKKAFSAMYGYTSDAGGIRHAMLEEGAVDLAEARYMLVICSAFISYLVERGSSTGLLR